MACQGSFRALTGPAPAFRSPRLHAVRSVWRGAWQELVEVWSKQAKTPLDLPIVIYQFSRLECEFGARDADFVATAERSRLFPRRLRGIRQGRGHRSGRVQFCDGNTPN